MPYIKIENISKTFSGKGQGIHALDDISFELEKNQFVSIVGPSGCGKTTLLKILSGLVKRSSGRILVNGKEMENLPDYGLVFQVPILIPWGTVTDNILLPIELMSLKKKKYRERAIELIRMTGLDGFEGAHPWELSGGMQQRVSIARALITDPSVLLMDEPLGSLDAITRDIMSFELLRIWERAKKTVLFVTHSIPEAVILSDRVVIMTSRPGRIAKMFDIEIGRPRDLKVRSTAEFTEYIANITDELYSHYGDIRHYDSRH